MSVLAITSGEPAGIGPELCLQLAMNGLHNRQATPLPTVVLADPDLLRARANQLGLNVQIIEAMPEKVAQPGQLYCLPIRLNQPAEPGILNPANASYVLSMLARATDGCLSGEFSAVVTAPVHKGVINDAGIQFSGHTEFLQARCAVERVVMMLTTEGLRVALVTTHLPLKEVLAAITKQRLRQVLTILIHDLQTKFGIAAPRILVAGVNPHAGEGGHMGMEEIETLIPVMEEYRQQGHQLIGPLPADTLFTPHHLAQADAVLAMYHDQGLPVLKYKGFGAAVNITLGLPIIRTSVDHGTALDLAGTGKADTGSLQTALNYAAEMVAATD